MTVRWPRPCLGLMYGVGALASEFLLGDAAVNYTTHHAEKASAIRNVIVFRRAVVKPEYIFGGWPGLKLATCGAGRISLRYLEGHCSMATPQNAARLYYWPAGGCHSSTLFPSGSITQANFPYSDSSIFSSTLQPSSRKALTSAWRSSTR